MLLKMNAGTTPATVAPVPEAPPPFSFSDETVPCPLPLIDTLPSDSQEGFEPEDEGGYFLFHLARKYNMAWALKGDTPCVQSELGRPSAVRTFDKMCLPPGAGIDILTYVNAHLKVPALDAIPDDLRSQLVDAPRRPKPLSSSGYKPLPMSRYTTEISTLTSFLDEVMIGPLGSSLPSPSFPKEVVASKLLTLSALEGITALNVLNELPETATKEDRDALSDHLGSILYAILRRGSETLGTGIRAVRQAQLGGVNQALREELVHQPILLDTLYYDDKKLCLATQPPPKKAKFFNYRGTRGAWNTPAALGAPPGGFQPQGGNFRQPFARRGGRTRPPSARQNYRGGRGGRRGRR